MAARPGKSGTRAHKGTAVLGAVLVATLGTSFAAHAQSLGEALYRKYCSACHGPQGKGDGVVSGFMRPKPTDLTQLARKAGGEFPYMRTMMVIDGRQHIRAHGDPDMPVWGEVFWAESTAPITRAAELRGKLMLITEYLQSIQEKPR